MTFAGDAGKGSAHHGVLCLSIPTRQKSRASRIGGTQFASVTPYAERNVKENL